MNFSFLVVWFASFTQLPALKTFFSLPFFTQPFHPSFSSSSYFSCSSRNNLSSSFHTFPNDFTNWCAFFHFKYQQIDFMCIVSMLLLLFWLWVLMMIPQTDDPNVLINIKHEVKRKKIINFYFFANRNSHEIFSLPKKVTTPP